MPQPEKNVKTFKKRTRMIGKPRERKQAKGILFKRKFANLPVTEELKRLIDA